MLQALETELKIRGFTPATVKAYKVHNQRFLTFINKKPDHIKENDVKQYLAHLFADKKLKPASVHLHVYSFAHSQS